MKKEKNPGKFKRFLKKIFSKTVFVNLFIGVGVFTVGIVLSGLFIFFLTMQGVITNPYVVAASYTINNVIDKNVEEDYDPKHLSREQEANMQSDPTEVASLTSEEIAIIQPYVDIINEANNNINTLTVKDVPENYDLIWEQVEIILDTKAEMQKVVEENPDLKAKLMPEKSTAYNDLSVGMPFSDQWENYGDIYYCSKDVAEGKKLPPNGHIAIGYYLDTMTIEAWPMVFSPNLDLPNDGVQIAENWERYWVAEDVCSPAYHLRVYGATPTDYNQAMQYSLNAISEPYNWSLTYAFDGFYCSELGALAWAAAGFDVNSGDDFDQVLPVEMLLSPNTFIMPMEE